MKHKLLSLIALTGAMFMSTSVFAQWDAPVKPTLNENNVSTVESGKTYYFKNVGSGQFLAGGGAWATQAVLTWSGMDDTSREALRILVSDSIGKIKGTEVPGVSLKLDGTFKTKGTSNRDDYSVGNTYIFRDSETAGFIDHGSQDKGYIWVITKNTANGYWRIQTPVEDSNYPDAATQYAGWLSTQGPIAVDDDGELVPFNLDEGLYPFTDVRFNLTEDTEGAEIDWMLIEPGEYLQALEVYQVRKDLYDALMEASEAGVDAETLNAAGAVYTNASATAEDMLKQKAHLLAAIAGLNYDFSGASEDSPLDVTDQVLVNPAFEDGNINGWVCTFVKGSTATNVGYQGASYTNGDVSINKFIEAWQQNTDTKKVIGDGKLCQTVYGLPKGKYVLEADVIAVDQNQGKNPVTGVYIYIQTEENEVKQAVATGNGKPEHFSVTFISYGDDEITFGLKTETATANWIAADNFQITYYGETTMTQGQLDLDAAITQAEELKDAENYIGYRPTLNAFEQLLADSKDLLNGDKQAEEVYQDATTALNAAQDSVKATIAAYEVLYKYYTFELDKYIEIATKMGWDDLSEEFTDLIDEWELAYEDGTMTNDEIYAQTDSIYPKLIASINPDNVEVGTDLTWLLKNPSFDDGTNGWTMTKDGGNTGTVSVDDGVDYHEVEFWRSKFDINQTIANMPAGVYGITVQGFSRNENDQTNPNSTIQIELYAGNSTAKFMNLLDPNQVRLVEGNEPLFDGTNPDKVFTIDGVEYYAPNGMGCAAAYFAAENEKTGEPYYTNHIKVTLYETGDFTIGVRSYDKEEWTLFDNFKITYLGTDVETYIQLIDEKVEELEKAYGAIVAADGCITTEGETRYNNVKDQANEAKVNINSSNAKEIFPVIFGALDDVIKYLKEGAEKGEDIAILIEEYGYRKDDVPTADEGDFAGYLDDLAAALAFGGIENNEAFDAIPEEIGTRWSQLIMEFALENPYKKTEDEKGMMNFGNATEAIYNGNYFSYLNNVSDAKGWSLEVPDTISKQIGTNFEVAEVFDATSFTVFQTVKGLKPGYYIVSVDAFYRPGASNTITTETEANIQNVEMFAETKEGRFFKAIKNVMAGAQPEKLCEGTEGTESTITINDEVSYIPLNMEAAATYLLQENEEEYIVPAMEGAITTSIYRNDMTCQVGDDGILTIGLTNNEQYIASDWTLFDNWQLTYIGTEEPDGIKSAEEKAADSVKSIFLLDGRASKSLKPGVNIIRSAKGVEKVLTK